MRSFRHITALALLFFIPVLAAFAGDTLDQGIKAFREQNTTQARMLLEKAAEEEPGNDRVYLYLGIVYQVSGQQDRAEQIMLKGINLSGPHSSQIRFNLGNLYFSREIYDKAADQYSAVITAGGEFAPKAVLNRANVGMKTGRYGEAVTDYEKYLFLVPDSPQRSNIEKLLALLRNQIAREEEEKRIAEENRIAEEKRRQEEEARQQALLNDILGDLDMAGGDTTNYSAGSEDIEQDFSDSDIED